MYEADPTANNIVIATSEAPTDLDDSSRWSGNASNKDGVSLLSTLDFAAGAAPDLSSLAGKLGVTPGSTFYEQRKRLGEGFAQLSLAASYNATAVNKGRSHSTLTAISPEALSRDQNPVDGKELALHLRASDRLAMVSQISQSAAKFGGDYRCQHEWWCLLCNADMLLKETVKLGHTWDELKAGKFCFNEEMLKQIVTLGFEGMFCSCQGERRLAQPPFGVTILCPSTSCATWIDTPQSLLCKGCNNCGIAFSAPLPKGLMDDPAKISAPLSIERQVEALRYSYIRVRKDQCSLEGGGARRVTTLSDCKIALNQLRRNPAAFKTPISFVVTERILLWLPTWTWDRTGARGLCLWDFQPRKVKTCEPFSLDALNQMAKRGDRGEFPPPDCLRGYPVEPSADAEEADWEIYEDENVSFIRYVLDCFKIGCEAMVFCSEEGYSIDIKPALDALTTEFLHHSVVDYSEWWLAAETIHCCMEDMSNRLDLQCRYTTSTNLTEYERQNGGTIRFLPSLSCETVVRHIYLPMEQEHRSLGRRSIKSSFIMGRIAESQKADVQRQAKKQKREEQKKAEEKAAKKQAKQAEKDKAAAAEMQQKKKKAADKKKKEQTAEKQKKKEAAYQADRKAADKAEREAKRAAEAERKLKGAEARAKRLEAELKKPSPRPKGKKPGGKEGRARGQVQPEVHWQDGAGEHTSGSEADSASEESVRSAGEVTTDEAVVLSDEDEASSGRAAVSCRTATLGGSNPHISLKQGDLHGDCPLPLARKLDSSLPLVISSDGKRTQVCFWFNTAAGCSHPCCARAHVKLASSAFTAPWHCLFSSLGGHWALKGEVSAESVESLLSEPQRENNLGLSNQLRHQVLLYHLANRLASLSSPTNEVISTSPVQLGKTNLHEFSLWDCNSPMQVATPGLLPALEIKRVLVGCPDAVFSGLSYDSGQLVRYSQDGYVDYMCQVKSVASVLSGHPELNAHKWKLSPDLRILQEVVQSLLSIDPAKIPTSSRLALLYTMCSKAPEKGFPDSLWAVASSPLLKDKHILSICLDAGPLRYKLNLAEGTVGRHGELDYNATNWKQLAKRPFTEAALSQEVLVVLTSAPPSSSAGALRHSRGLCLGKGYSLQRVVKKLAAFASQGKGRVTLSERGCFQKLALKEIGGKFSRERLIQCQADLQLLAQKLGPPGSPLSQDTESAAGATSAAAHSTMGKGLSQDLSN